MKVPEKVRTTVTLEKDVAAAVAKLRREKDLGVSEAINDLIRAGLIAPKEEREPFVQETHDMGLKVDITHIGKVLDELDFPQDR